VGRVRGVMEGGVGGGGVVGETWGEGGGGLWEGWGGAG
jgi:hypothetical protein